MLLLLACHSTTPKDSTPAADVCAEDVLTASIQSPANSAVFLLGEEISLVGTGTTTASSIVTYQWAVDGAPLATTASATWTPTETGSFILSLTVVDGCNLSHTASVGITVAEPAPSGVEVYTTEDGLPATSWYGLSVAPDGTVWGASAHGLIHLDPSTRAVRSYSSADGLYTDTPIAVLAHSDGTLWVGHLGTVDRQGEQLTINTDGSLTVLRNIDYTETSEILSVFRLREQRYGVGVGDVWMGTNEGLCLFDADLAVFQEHAHPTHPHYYSYGVGFTEDGHIWNGDSYQLSRWNYSNDGDLSTSADLMEYWVPYEVTVEVDTADTGVDYIPIDIRDVDASGMTLWVASALYGLARVDVGATSGTSTTTQIFSTPAVAARVDNSGGVWVGTESGLIHYDTTTGQSTTYTDDWLPSNTVQQIAVDLTTVPATVWIATPSGLVKIVGVP